MNTTFRHLAHVFAVAGLLALAAPACAPVGTGLPSRCEAIEVDPMRELVITDPSIVSDARIDFAHVMGAVFENDSGSSAQTWMDAWAALPGEETLKTDVEDPWAASSANGLDVLKAPFELIAISNRLDLTTLGPNRAGEMRFVYGLVTSGTRRPLTVIVELQYPITRTNSEWASAWHALGSLSGAANADALFAIVDSVLVEPLHGQVRTQDARMFPSALFEFDLRAEGPLAPSGLFNQPSDTVKVWDLVAFVSDDESAVLAAGQVLPSAMRALSVLVVPPTFDLRGIPSNVATAFTDATCSGCHTAEATLDGTFHVSPLRRGEAALSPFLNNPSGAPDELSRRAEVFRGLLCVQ